MGIFFFIGCENELQKVKLVTDSNQLPTETSYNTKIYMSDSGNVKMVLNAKLLNRYTITEDPYTEFPEGIFIEFFDNKGELQSTIKANYGINKDKAKEMVVKGNVVVINVDSVILETEKLIWREGDEKITTDEFVKITTQDEIIFGDGLDASEDFSNYRIKNIKGTLKIKEDE